MNVLAIIPARGGSKSIPRKNIRSLAGHPLIAYSIAAAKVSKYVDRILVSTDDDEIAAAAKGYGAEVPFMRPAEYARDDTEDLPVFQHALNFLADSEGYTPDIIVHLRPTTPFRHASDIDGAVERLKSRPDYHSVRGISLPLTSPYKMYRIDEGGALQPLFKTERPNAHNMPRQKLPVVYRGNGAIDITWRDTIMTLGSMTGDTILPWILGPERCVDIDTPEDWEYAEWLVECRRRVLPVINRP